MTLQKILHLAAKAAADPSSSLLETKDAGEFTPAAELLNSLILENRSLRRHNQKTVTYLRRKIDQLLMVIGTIPLRPEELDNETLINLDPIGIIAESFTQILEHLRQTNDELELAMDEIQAIFESVGGGILVLDSKKNILSYNHKLIQMFGSQTNELEGQTCHGLICQGEKSEDCPFEKMMETGRTVSTAAGCPRGGRFYSIVTTPVKDRNNKIVRAVLLYIDITELVEAKEAVANEKERLSLTLKSIAEGVIATDKEGNITLMNEVATKLTGLSLDDTVGKSACEVLNISSGKNKESCLDIFKKILLQESKFERITQAILASRDGKERMISLSVAPIRRQNQAIAGSILVFRDISQEKKMEMELVRSRRIESLGILAGGIAHDFNNLLTSIMGNASLAQTLVDPDDKIFSLLSDTKKASLRAKNLTQQLLTFAKGGAPVTALTSTRKLIEESAIFSSSGSKTKCEFHLPEDLWQVEVDEGQVGQVIQNLVINADQAMPHGGTIHIGAENITMTEDNPLFREENYIKIFVKDSGEGISPKHLDTIFDPYFTTKETGHGLGLTICYSIINKHHGHIMAESEPGSGSCFSIYLPALKGQVSEVEETGDKTIAGQGRILVMDDEEIVRDISNEMLTYLGYQVDLSSNGQEAIDLYIRAQNEGNPFQAVLMDLTIPGGMGGKETIEELLKIDPDVKALVSSGYANDAIMAEYRRYGFSGVVPKPFSIEELSTALDKICNGP